MDTSEPPPDFTHLDDPAFLDERARVRRLLEREPPNAAGRARLEQLYADLTDEFLHRARIAWARAT
jgi:hypothetical protein